MARKIERIDPASRAPVQLVGDVYNKIAEIAENEERTMGGQVAYLVKKNCAHPQESRIKIDIVVSIVEQATKKTVARVGKDQPYRGFFCTTCGQYILPELTEAASKACDEAK